MYFWRHLVLTVVEHTTLLLRSSHLQSLPLVGTAILEFGSGEFPYRWSLLKQWMSPDAEDEG